MCPNGPKDRQPSSAPWPEPSGIGYAHALFAYGRISLGTRCKRASGTVLDSAWESGRSAECWAFWSRAGLRRADIFRALAKDRSLRKVTFQDLDVVIARSELGGLASVVALSRSQASDYGRLRITDGHKVNPYAGGGVGYYRRTVQFTQPTLTPVFFFDPFFDPFSRN